MPGMHREFCWSCKNCPGMNFFWSLETGMGIKFQGFPEFLESQLETSSNSRDSRIFRSLCFWRVPAISGIPRFSGVPAAVPAGSQSSLIPRSMDSRENLLPQDPQEPLVVYPWIHLERSMGGFVGFIVVHDSHSQPFSLEIVAAFPTFP